MASVEEQKSSTYLSSSDLSKIQQLTRIPDESNFEQDINSDIWETTARNTKHDIEHALPIKNCNQEKNENKKDEIILERHKKEVKSKISKTESAQNSGDSNITPLISENDLKINENESVKESLIRTGNNLKRTRRNFVTQETDILAEEHNSRSKRKKKNSNDRFCWRCHKESVEAHCSACPRSWHRKCVGMQQSIIQNWICGECAAILRAENAETRSTAMAQLSIDQLCLLLKHVVERMREYPGSEPFWKAVELSEAPNYLDYVVKPMDLSLLESNVRAKLYGSTDAFMADAKWIQHNCIVFNTCGGVYTDTSKLTNAAKQIIKLARQEVSEIEACPDCYAHGRNLPRPQPAWFIEPCRRPHPLVWAKLKGFPFWPAKAMPRMNTQGFVDVRFFGEHDRAWVSPRDLYLYSEDPPVPLPRKRKLDMEECVREITRHCRKLELAFGQFKFAPPKVQYNPHDPMQIKLMLPNYDPLRSNSCTSPQLLAPKKTLFLKRRSHVKIKSQSDSEKAENSDAENKTSSNANLSDEPSAAEDKPHKEEQKPEKSSVIGSSTVALDLNESVERANVKHIKGHEDVPISLVATMKEDTKSSTSKTNTNDLNNEHSHAVKCDLNESSVPSLKRNQDCGDKETKGNSKPLTNLANQDDGSFSIKSLGTDIQEPKKEPLLKKMNLSKGNANQNSTNAERNNVKSLKSVQKVYKPKTRIVDKINAEKALRSVATEQNHNTTKNESINRSKENESTTIRNISKSNSTSNNNKNNNNSNNNNNNSTATVLNTPVSVNDVKPVVNVEHNIDLNAHNKNSIQEHVELILIKKPSGDLIAEKEKRSDVSGVQSNLKEPSQVLPQAKESKARKSFPNKARNCPQLIPRSSTSILSSSSDPVIYMSTHQVENTIEYQMLPPEAGPISARLYHGAQDLARKMAKLMEEAYKEAAQDNQRCESGTISENHQATVHFLRLQIERMRWQHQQQLAELKHNTDRILREMKASLEAERLRAVEETRREGEEEKLRCIEEIKRKQWCAMCGREALFYCCWNTAYCDYPCQQSHWPMHMRTCAQKPSFTTIVTSTTANSNQQQSYSMKINSSTEKVYPLPHDKLNEMSAALSFHCSKTEDNDKAS